MKTSTLKQLVIEASERMETKQDLLEEVIRLISLFEQDGMEGHQVFAPYVQPGESSKVPYHEICGCNPKNGGSGVCGCVIGNELIDRPISDVKLNNWVSTESFPGLTGLFGKENVTGE